MIRNRALPIAVIAFLVAAIGAPPVVATSLLVETTTPQVDAAVALAEGSPAPPAIQLDETKPPQLDVPSANKNPKADSSVAAVLQSHRLQGSVAALDSAQTQGLAVAGAKVRVIVEASDLKAVMRALADTGADVEGTAANLIEVLATPSQLQDVLDVPSVRYVRSPLPHVADAVPDEAVATTNASTWQQRGQSGAGVKVAIIDLGFTGYLSAQASGDLPASLTVIDECGGQLTTASRHGTAVAEIVHKMAPGAQLYLICVDTEVDLAIAAEYAKANGIGIISHSVSWFNTSRGDGSGEPGTPDATVADARANGILWVNAAGNSAQEHWTGNFIDDGDGWNEFASGDIGNTFYLPAGESACAFLKWDDWGGSSQDFDLYVVRSADGAYVVSENLQDGSQSPTEGVCFTNEGAGQPFFVAISEYEPTTAPRFDLFLTAGSELEYQVAAGSVTEPASSPAALAVGAACWRGTAIEPFSSRGPTIDGRVKPDLTGQDQVSTRTYGMSGTCASESGFAGTSAAAPHVAGAAALVKGAHPSYTADLIQSYLQAQAQDLGAAGTDSVFGYGLLPLPSVAFLPGAPSGVQGASGNNAVVVAWTAPKTDGGSPITGYTVTASPGGATCSTTGALTCTVQGLSNGSPYTFTVTASNSVGTGQPSAPSVEVKPLPGATYHALTPTRLLDSRSGNGLAGAFQARVARTFAVTGRGGVPADAIGVTGNLTVTQQTAGGYLYLGPVATNTPTSSTLNFPLGDTRANGVTVALGAGGTLSVTYAAAAGRTAHVLFDVTGYFTP